MITSLQNTDNIKEAIFPGVNDYIVNPVNAAMLPSKLESLRE